MPPDYSPAQAVHGIITHNEIYIVIFVIQRRKAALPVISCAPKKSLNRSPQSTRRNEFLFRRRRKPKFLCVLRDLLFKRFACVPERDK
jgi:hypothetical protein